MANRSPQPTWLPSGPKRHDQQVARTNRAGTEVAVHHHLIGPFWGNVAIIGVAGTMTVACFVLMFWLLLRPGEKDPHHPKYTVLRDDR
jgi:hypothetical protein